MDNYSAQAMECRLREKKQKQCCPNELDVGDCWIALSLADSSGLILTAGVGKHTDALIEELVVSTEGKTACRQWNSDNWGGYERGLPPEVLHHIGKDQTQSAPMELSGSRRDAGTDGRTNLANFGSRRR